MDEANVLFPQPHGFQCLEHVAIGRAGRIDGNSLAAQILQPCNAGVRHEHVVTDKVILGRNEKAITSGGHESYQSFRGSLVELDLAGR